MGKFLSSLDWWTVLIYLILVFAGWATIHSASYDVEAMPSIFEFARPSGKQIVWFAMSIFVIIIIMCLDSRTFINGAPILYTGIMLLEFLTIFIGTEINGSHSWIKIGSFSIQPAEFGKFSTSLMLAWLFDQNGFKFLTKKNFLLCCGIVILPVILILLQNETGSALVYFSLALLFYRQGMSGIVLWLGVSSIIMLVMGIKFGPELSLCVIPFITALTLYGWAERLRDAIMVAVSTVVMLLVVHFLPMFVEDIPYWPEDVWIYLGWNVLIGVVLLLKWLKETTEVTLPWTSLFIVMYVVLMYSASFAFSKLQPHQQGRIEVVLGMKEDLKGAGYNVNQAMIAIGSGKFLGKGYLQGTQTKLSYVPEQETDFIFCTVGEEWGFVGSTLLLLLYGLLIYRVIIIAERQTHVFGFVYGYCVACIIAFHILINVGMVIGLMPVIGIPLPLFSYGGSGMWSFTIMLFILLKLDVNHKEKY